MPTNETCYKRFLYAVTKNSTVKLRIDVQGPVRCHIAGMFVSKSVAWDENTNSMEIILNPDGSDLSLKEVIFTISCANESPDEATVTVSYDISGGIKQEHGESTVEKVASGDRVTCKLSIKFRPTPPQD